MVDVKDKKDTTTPPPAPQLTEVKWEDVGRRLNMVAEAANRVLENTGSGIISAPGFIVDGGNWALKHTTGIGYDRSLGKDSFHYVMGKLQEEDNDPNQLAHKLIVQNKTAAEEKTVGHIETGMNVALIAVNAPSAIRGGLSMLGKVPALVTSTTEALAAAPGVISRWASSASATISETVANVTKVAPRTVQEASAAAKAAERAGATGAQDIKFKQVATAKPAAAPEVTPITPTNDAAKRLAAQADNTAKAANQAGSTARSNSDNGIGAKARQFFSDNPEIGEAFSFAKTWGPRVYKTVKVAQATVAAVAMVPTLAVAGGAIYVAKKVKDFVSGDSSDSQPEQRTTNQRVAAATGAAAGTQTTNAGANAPATPSTPSPARRTGATMTTHNPEDEGKTPEQKAAAARVADEQAQADQRSALMRGLGIHSKEDGPGSFIQKNTTASLIGAGVAAYAASSVAENETGVWAWMKKSGAFAILTPLIAGAVSWLMEQFHITDRDVGHGIGKLWGATGGRVFGQEADADPAPARTQQTVHRQFGPRTPVEVQHTAPVLPEHRHPERTGRGAAGHHDPIAPTIDTQAPAPLPSNAPVQTTAAPVVAPVAAAAAAVAPVTTSVAKALDVQPADTTLQTAINPALAQTPDPAVVAVLNRATEAASAQLGSPALRQVVTQADGSSLHVYEGGDAPARVAQQTPIRREYGNDPVVALAPTQAPILFLG